MISAFLEKGAIKKLGAAFLAGFFMTGTAIAQEFSDPCPNSELVEWRERLVFQDLAITERIMAETVQIRPSAVQAIHDCILGLFSGGASSRISLPTMSSLIASLWANLAQRLCSAIEGAVGNNAAAINQSISPQVFQGQPAVYLGFGLGGQIGRPGFGGGGTLPPGDQPVACTSPRRSMSSNWTRLAMGFNEGCLYTAGGVHLLDVDCRRWGNIWGEPFWTGGATQRIATGRGQNPYQYLAAEFSTFGMPSVASGSYTAVEGIHAVPTSAIVSISECPGDFDRASLGDCMGILNTAGGALRWRTEGSSAIGNRCILQPNRRYFLNVVFTDQASQGLGALAGMTSQNIVPSGNCSPGPCGLIISP